jgi:hypothetical protein
MEQQEAADKAGLGTTVWGEIERADRTNFRSRTLSKACGAVRWGPDGFPRLLGGEDPIELPPETPAIAHVPGDDEIVAVVRQIRDLADEVLGMASRGGRP